MDTGARSKKEKGKANVYFRPPCFYFTGKRLMGDSSSCEVQISVLSIYGGEGKASTTPNL